MQSRQDATGQPICPFDLVMFQSTGGAGHDRGLAVKALPGNKISMLCADGGKVAKKASELTVVDRTTLCPGMAVTSTSDRTGQAGVVTGIATALDLVDLNADDEHTVVATGVSPAEVRPVKELNLGNYVVSGTWLGRVVELSVDVDVLFDDGSVCRVTRASDNNKLRALGKNGFCPGDRVAGDTSVFKASRWIKGHWKPSRGKGTVAKVEMGGVLVCWVASSLQSDPPAAYQPNTRNLTFFCSGDSDYKLVWAVSDRCFFRRPPHDALAPNKKKMRRRKWINRWRGGDRRRLLPKKDFEHPMAVAHTRTTVDVLWQDGTRQQGVPSASLLRIMARGEHDFFPGHRVMPKTTVGDNNDVGSRRVGVVKSLSYKDQTVCVSWITEQAPAAGECSEVMMSTYDLCRSSDYNFFYGDIVVRKHPKVEQAGATDNNGLSWVGHIVDLCDAQYIHVKWGDGITSKVFNLHFRPTHML